MAKEAADSNLLLQDLQEGLKDPRFAKELEEATRELRERFAGERRQELEEDPAKRYEDTPDLGEVEGWSEELDEWIAQLTEQAELTTDPQVKELLYRRAWLLRGANEHAWQYIALG